MVLLNENYRYVLEGETAIEDFKQGSLVFLSVQQRVIEINHSASRILQLVDGKRNLRQIIKLFAYDLEMNKHDVRNDVQELITVMAENGVVRPLVQVIEKRSEGMSNLLSLMVNPDVSLREEEDGALLFKFDTNALQIINPVGLLIWKFLNVHPRTKLDIVNHLKEECEDVPTDQVEQDVNSFIDELYHNGFIMEVTNDEEL